MDDRLILPVKRVTDRITISVDFSSLTSVDLSSATVSVYVHSGYDSNPEDMIVGSAVASGSVVSQKIRAGLPGVVYLLAFKAIGLDESEYIIYAFQAVLPLDGSAIPNYIIRYITSWPYPILFNDAISASSTMTGGKTLWYPPEFMAASTVLISGTLVTIIVTYDNGVPEELTGIASFISGSIVSVLLIYSDWPPESLMSDNIEFLSGTLVIVLLQYTNWIPENLTSSSINMLGGSIT